MTTFTLAIPTHDRRETVVLAVQSVLRQTRVPEQIIVTCDGCTDGTADALRALGDDRIAVIELDKGAGYAYGHRNVALEQATGDVITWLADDDLLLPEHVERLAQRWALGDVDLVTTAAVIVEPDDGLEWIGSDWSVPYFRNALERYNTNVMASVSARTALLRTVGGWDDAIERAADWDLWKRALHAGGRPAMVDEPTVLHFRATGRTQAWPSRVRQNAAWLERIGEAEALPSLRRELRRTRGVRDAVLQEQQETHAGHLEAQRDAARAENDALRGRLDDQERELAGLRDRLERHDRRGDELGRQLDEQRTRADAAARRLAVVAAEAERHRATLEAIYAGGWWRLRGGVRRVVVPLRARGRGRGGSEHGDG